MRVELTQFCQDFTAGLRPLSRSLDDSIVALHELEEPSPLRDLLSAFVDIQHRLKILTDKAEQQHAYLLIFGPLKSGKSTLMNAISGSYVSEVSSLPAYPCLVYVHEGEPRTCSITRFDGSKESFDSEEALLEHIEEAHAEIAEQLRQADREQRTFNPATDYPRAIRRIDYVVPAPNLRQSGTILVDTPGLYTKMRYNYEQLTRDFRHNAACAVFVVKTDNLFFDSVFDEFKDLLGVFSRIFLVVNVDSSKQDLAPKGELRPALESREPRRIIQAFEDFTASAQLRGAIDSGQLQIYLVDLLKTARRSLSGENLNPLDALGAESVSPGEGEPAPEPLPPGGNATEGVDRVPGAQGEGEAEGDEPAPDQAAHPHAEVGFEAFLRDLTRYLNSSDYIVEFMADSLRQGEHLVEEIRGEMAADAVHRFRDDSSAVQAEAESLGDRLKHIEALRETDWEEALSTVSEELEQERVRFTEGELRILRDRLESHVNDWFGSDQSLQDLLDQRLKPAIKSTDEKLRGRVQELARQRFQQRNSGLQLDARTVGHLHKLDLSLNALFQDFSQKQEQPASDTNGIPPLHLHQEELPVKKSFLDWITFRSPRAVRRNVLGTEDPSERPLPPATKDKRLGDAGRQHLLAQVDRYVREDLQDRDKQELQATLEAYRSYCKESIRGRLDASREEIQQREKTLRARFEASRRVIAALEELNTASDQTVTTADELRDRFVGDRSQAPVAIDSAQSEDAARTPTPSVTDLEDDSPDPATAMEIKESQEDTGLGEDETLQDTPEELEDPRSSQGPR